MDSADQVASKINIDVTDEELKLLVEVLNSHYNLLVQMLCEMQLQGLENQQGYLVYDSERVMLEKLGKLICDSVLGASGC